MKKFVDMVGKQFGRWTVLKYSGTRNYHVLWLCRCSCGIIRNVLADSLKRGISQSCGCLSGELSRKRMLKHGDIKIIDGAYLQTKEYQAWASMIRRCYSKYNNSYHDYGGRGIRVCKQWLHSYLNFLQDMGRAPSSKHSLDRKNNKGNYTPKNCRWATAKQQACNRRKRRNRVGAIL